LIEKSVLITGGAGGLGKELTMALALKDYSVNVIDKLPFEAVSPDCQKAFKRYYQLDLSDPIAVLRFIKCHLVDDRLTIDIFIVNAFPRVFKNFAEFKEQEIIEFVNTSFLSQILLANAIVKGMIDRGEGRIITIGSKAALRGYSTGSLYCSMKSAWLVFHESLSKELSASGRNISITTICPNSFSDRSGKKLPNYDSIVGKVEDAVFKALMNSESRIEFTLNLRSRMALLMQMLGKMIRI
jgi:short-subunit dehydrogenase